MNITSLSFLNIITLNAIAGFIFALVNYLILLAFERRESGKMRQCLTIPAVLLWPMTVSEMNESEGIDPLIYDLEPWQYLLGMTIIGPLPKIIFNIFPLAVIFGPWVVDLFFDAVGCLILVIMNFFKVMSGERMEWKL